MRIANSAIAMKAASHSETAFKKQESASLTIAGRNIRLPSGFRQPVDTLDISEQLRHLNSFQLSASPQADSANNDGTITLELSDKDRQKLELLQKMVEKLTGKKFKFFIIDKVKLPDGGTSGAVQPQAPKVGQPQTGQGARPFVAGFSFQYDYSETYIERQAMSFQSHGVVNTADGRTINFNVELNMSREFMTQNEIHIVAGDKQADPLVINFSGQAADLTDRNFSFDLNNDGAQERIAFVKPGSGFLALDKNADGQINSGSELFGPNSGNGFAELAQYDSDGNNWIDENDAIYDKLKIWTKDENGKETLFALGQKGIGAIYLGNAQSLFDMKNASNQSLGTVRSTGIFLKEDGTAGTVQHIDLTL